MKKTLLLTSDIAWKQIHSLISEIHKGNVKEAELLKNSDFATLLECIKDDVSIFFRIPPVLRDDDIVKKYCILNNKMVESEILKDEYRQRERMNAFLGLSQYMVPICQKN